MVTTLSCKFSAFSEHSDCNRCKVPKQPQKCTCTRRSTLYQPVSVGWPGWWTDNISSDRSFVCKNYFTPTLVDTVSRLSELHCITLLDILTIDGLFPEAAFVSLYCNTHLLVKNIDILMYLIVAAWNIFGLCSAISSRYSQCFTCFSYRAKARSIHLQKN